MFRMGFEPAMSVFQVQPSPLGHAVYLLSSVLYISFTRVSSNLDPRSKGGKRERVRMEVESLALIWRVINWLILVNWLIISLIFISMSLRAIWKRSEQLTFHFAELMFYSVKARCNYIFLWNIVFCNVWLDTSCHIFPQDTSDRTAPLPARTPLYSLRKLGDK